jgi:hypothetical protein
MDMPAADKVSGSTLSRSDPWESAAGGDDPIDDAEDAAVRADRDVADGRPGPRALRVDRVAESAVRWDRGCDERRIVTGRGHQTELPEDLHAYIRGLEATPQIYKRARCRWVVLRRAPDARQDALLRACDLIEALVRRRP